MANASITLTIPEAEVAKVKKALMGYTGLPATATAKELAKAALAQLVQTQEKAESSPTAPVIE